MHKTSNVNIPQETNKNKYKVLILFGIEIKLMKLK